MRSWLAAIVAIVAVLAVPAGASADPTPPRERAALAAIDLGPTVPAYLRGKATLQIEDGLAAAGYEVVPTSQVAPRLTGELASCREGACIRLVGEALAVRSLVYATITRKDDGSVIAMRLYDATTTLPIAEVHEVCDLCGEAELAERLSVAASALRARAIEARAREAALATPPAPPQPGPPQPPAPPSLVPATALGAAGVLAVAAGAYLIHIDGRGTCHAGDTPVYPAQGAVIRYPNGIGDPGDFVCRDVYATKTGGIVTASVGALAIATAVALVLHARRSDRVIEVVPQPGGATLGGSWAW